MPAVSTYGLIARTAGDFLLGTNSAGAVKRFAESGRELVAAARTYFVRTDGSNTNDGLTNSAGGAFLTLQFAMDLINSRLDLGGNTITIQAGQASQTWPAFHIKGWVGGGMVVLHLNGGTITSGSDYPISSVESFPTFKIQNMTVTSTSASFFCGAVSVFHAGTLLVGASCVFGSVDTTSAHLYAGVAGAAIIFTASWTVSGSAVAHIQIFYPSALISQNVSSLVCTVSGTPAFGTAFALAAHPGVIRFYSLTFSGAATGKRYDASLNAVIDSGGGGATFFPGNVTGTTATGGQYV